MTPSDHRAAHAREFLAASLAAGDTARAIQAARALLQEDPSTRQLSFVHNAIQRIPAAKLALKPLRVALLSSFSIEFVRRPLVALSFLDRLRLEIYQAGFGQFRQEILDPRSGLYAFAPDVVVLAAEGKDWVPPIYAEYLAHRESSLDECIAGLQEEITALIRTLRSHSKALFLVHNFAPPTWPQLGVLDGHVGMGQLEAVQKLNGALYSLARHAAGVYVVDYAGLVARHGALSWNDDRMEHYARAPVAHEMLRHLAAEYAKFLRAITGGTKKCLVLDLDNTLWGGVLGEEGLDGIALGPEYPGSAYVAFQMQLLNLHRRGVILAIASKNNLEDVDEVFAKHRHMVLKKEHFSHAEIHWKPKSDSLARIAEELDIGLEHMVFMDDDPVECQQVAAALPALTVKPLPRAPEGFVRALMEDGLFDALSYSAEDRQRGELYRRRAEARALREQSASLEDFYRGLAMEVAFAPVSETSLGRAAQLTQKTNQFNVATIRYSEAELSSRMAGPGWLLTTVSVRDRYGDHGIVGLMMAELKGEEIAVDSFLLSCRVIGRTIETAMLAYLWDEARRRGLTFLRGRLIPTAKNAPARDLFQRHGFRRVAGEEGGETSWTLELAKDVIRCPEWITVVGDAHPSEGPSN